MAEITTLPRLKDPTSALRVRRYRAQKKANKDKPMLTVGRTAAIDVTAYVAAVALAGAAAWFSIRGMVVLFPGSPLSVVGMAVAMEAAKLVTAGWLARRWRATAWVWSMNRRKPARASSMSASARRVALAALQGERASVAAKGKAAALEAAPIQYVAAVFGISDSEEAIRWLIALMVLCCDPLAIALTAAASARRVNATL